MKTLRHVDELIAAGLVAPARRAAVAAVAARYAVALTPAVVELIDRGDPADPIARQYVPDPDELEPGAGARGDPIGDAAHAPLKGIVHRYPDRVLLMPLLHCPVYCRFCFRREAVGGDKGLSDAELDAALDYVRRDPRIWEVVVTGGDPLMLPARRLARLVRQLDAIEHLGVIRFHSRVPVGDPARLTDATVAALAGADKAVWLAVHCNHPRELSAAARAACRRLVSAGIPLLGQTVLLKGVNDDPAVMEALMRALVRNRIKPYYLHHLDLAPGTARFRVPIADGQALMRRLRGRVSGLCQPSYVLDIPGGHGKAPLGPTYLDDAGTVEDWRGQRHRYPPTDDD